MNEICHDDAEERAIVIGVAQTLGQAFIAWVPGKSSISSCYESLFTNILFSGNTECRQVRTQIQDGIYRHVRPQCLRICHDLCDQVFCRSGWQETGEY